MKILGYVFVGLCLIAFGIVSVKLGWFDYVVSFFQGVIK